MIKFFLLYPVVIITKIGLSILAKFDCVYINIWKDSTVKTYGSTSIFNTGNQIDLSVVIDDSIILTKNGTPIRK